MIYAHVCTPADVNTIRTEEAMTPDIGCKAPGIFAQMKETDEVLTDIMFMLDMFKHEIRGYDIPQGECKPAEPTCFRDAIAMVNSKAYAIKGDLERLIGEFR